MTIQQLAKQELKIIRQVRKFEGHVALNLHDYYEYCTKETIDGLWLEFGVWCGASLSILAKLSPVIVYGFDSFQGLPEQWQQSKKYAFEKGTFKLNKIPKFPFGNHELIPGLFEDTLPKFLTQHADNCAVIHIDSDIYSSCKTVLVNLRPRIVPGTIILFDELINYELYYEHEMKAWLEEDFQYEYLARTNGPQVGVKIC